MTYPLSIVLLLLILLSSNVHSLTNDNTWYGHTLSTSSTSVVQMYINSETSGTEHQVKISSSVIEDRNRALLDQNIAIYEKERRRNLSWWGSFMSKLRRISAQPYAVFSQFCSFNSAVSLTNVAITLIAKKQAHSRLHLMDILLPLPPQQRLTTQKSRMLYLMTKTAGGVDAAVLIGVFQ